MELIADIVTSFVLHKVRIYIPELWVPFLKNERDFTGWSNMACRFLLKKSLIYVLRKLASHVRDLNVRQFLLNMPYCFRNKKMVSKPTAVIVV